MIKFFRKIRHNLIAEGKTGKYLKYAIGEIMLVVIGILIAMQINNWNENRKARDQEHSSMIEVIENLRFDIIRCEKNYLNNTNIIHGLDSLRTSIGNTIDGIDETNSIYYHSIKYSDGFGQAVINRSAYDEMISSGTVKLIKNNTLKFSLSDYYERISTVVISTNLQTSLSNLLNCMKNLINLREMKDYIESSESRSFTNYGVIYNYESILKIPGLKLLHTNEEDLNRYYNEVSQYELELKSYNFYLSWLKASAEKLIQDIEKDYQIK